jgi:hypothetical protein
MDEVSGTNGGARAAVMREAMAVAGELPRPVPRAVLCPYCGSASPGSDRCASCGGRFDPLSRQATQNHMGPWFLRDDRSPHRPGCTYDTLIRMVDAGQIGPDAVLRGPSTRQFWTLARHTPGVAQRFGFCHNCRASVSRDAFQCPSCHASFSVDRDRQHLGVGEARPLPGKAAPEVLAMQAGATTPQAVVAVQPPGFAGGAGPDDAAERGTRERAARWREQAEKDRTRGVIALVLAALVVLVSIFYGAVVRTKSAPSAPQPVAAEG